MFYYPYKIDQTAIAIKYLKFKVFINVKCFYL